MKEQKREYGCIMVYLKVNQSEWDLIQSYIDEEDIYNEPSYGRETEPHVTILYGLHGYITDEEIEKQIYKMSIPDIKLKSVSLFTGNFDVLKFDVDSQDMVELNKTFKEQFPNTNTFNYVPHCTIAYLKRKSEYYVNVISALKRGLELNVTAEKVVYSKVDGTKKIYNLWHS